jgi:hypothetical protein
LLANLWARGTALQGAFNRGSIEALIVMYHGRIEGGASFDPTLLSGVMVRVKGKRARDVRTGREIPPVGVPPDETAPRAYLSLSLVLELGTESPHQETGSAIKVVMGNGEETEFGKLVNEWRETREEVQGLEAGVRKREKKAGDGELKEAWEKVRPEAMDKFNRYVISIRGLSGYGILEKAKIKEEFEMLLRATNGLGRLEEENLLDLMEEMQPFRTLGTSGHVRWMRKYVVKKRVDGPSV